MDVRMYNQQNLFLYYNRGVGVFSTIGEMAQKFRGPIGVLHGFAAAISAVFTGFVYIFTCLKAMGRRVWGRFHHPVCGCSHRPVAEPFLPL